MDAGRTIEDPQCFSLGPLIALYYIAGFEPHADQLLGFPHQLACQDDDHVGGVPDLGLLLLTGHDDQLGGGMDDIELVEDGGGVGGEDHFLEVVDDDFVAAIGAEGGLHGLGDGSTCFDVAYDGAVFGIVAVFQLSEPKCSRFGGLDAGLSSYLL